MVKKLLDKTVEYKQIIMRLKYEKNNAFTDIVLPHGYKFKFYAAGDEKQWAKTLMQVLEFPTCEKALEYFNTELLSYADCLSERMVFIENENHELVANACAWYKDFKGVHQAHVHYVAVRPEFQNMGLGKAVFLKTMSLFPKYEPGEDIYLHTQTWSHKAIGMYLRYGFEIITDDLANYHEKQLADALEVLQTLIPIDAETIIKNNKKHN